MPGDFFDSVAAGGDIYLLKSVVHNWDDRQVSRILRICRRAMTPNSRLVLVERAVPERMRCCSEHQALARSDLNMLVGLGGRERTRREFADLLSDSEFGAPRFMPVTSEFELIEAQPIWERHQ